MVPEPHSPGEGLPTSTLAPGAPPCTQPGGTPAGPGWGARRSPSSPSKEPGDRGVQAAARRAPPQHLRHCVRLEGGPGPPGRGGGEHPRQGGPAVVFMSPGEVTGPRESHLFLHRALRLLIPSPHVPPAKFDLIWRDQPGSPLLRAQRPPCPSSLLSLGFKPFRFVHSLQD